MNHTEMTPSVFIKDGGVYANSRDVAAYFGKNHRDVTRVVDELIEQGVRNFTHTPYVHPQNGEVYRSYDMDRDGFTLLAMSFTGPKALKFKLAYIAQFNAMEEELRQQDEDQDIIPFTPEAEARMLVGEARRTFGPKAAQQLWGQLGLPVVPAMLIPSPQMEMTFTATLQAANQNVRSLAA